jgi:uncharacterized protein YwgA
MKLKPDLGKTKIMKILYMLQQVKNVDLGYEFDIYTYGPYAPEVLESVDELIEKELVTSKMYRYNNYVGYKLNLTEKGKQALTEINQEDSSSLHDILSFTEGCSAKDLELYSTIIFVSSFYSRCKGKFSAIDVKNKVQEIKPHFDIGEISESYESLVKENYVKV